MPVIECTAGERKHLIAEECVSAYTVDKGASCPLAAAHCVEGQPAQFGVIRNLEKEEVARQPYSFHIVDPTWGKLASKMKASGMKRP